MKTYSAGITAMEEMTMKDTIENTEVIESPETTEPAEVPETMEVSETAEVSDTLESSETSQEEADKKPGKKKEKTAEKIIAQGNQAPGASGGQSEGHGTFPGALPSMCNGDFLSGADLC